MKKDLQPCVTCPWRKSSTVGGTDIPGFSLELMRRLSNTVGPGDAFRTIMACHHSKPGKDVACKGYIAREGYSNINARVLAARGIIPMTDIIAACKGIPLWRSFTAMLKAYESANAKAKVNRRVREAPHD